MAQQQYTFELIFSSTAYTDMLEGNAPYVSEVQIRGHARTQIRTAFTEHLQSVLQDPRTVLTFTKYGDGLSNYPLRVAWSEEAQKWAIDDMGQVTYLDTEDAVNFLPTRCDAYVYQRRVQ